MSVEARQTCKGDGCTHIVWQRKSENGLASFSRRAAFCVSRESATQRYACMRTAGPRYWSWFHQYDGHEVEQHAQRMHCRSRRAQCQHALAAAATSAVIRTHLVHAVKLETVLLRLQVLPPVCRPLRLKVRLDRLVLLVEPVAIAQVSSEIERLRCGRERTGSCRGRGP